MKKSNSDFILPNISSLNKSVFMTITDDIGFAKMQIDKINQSINLGNKKGDKKILRLPVKRIIVYAMGKLIIK